MIRFHALIALCAFPVSLLCMEPFCTAIEQQYPTTIPRPKYAQIIRTTVRTVAEEMELMEKSTHSVVQDGTPNKVFTIVPMTQGRGYLEHEQLSWLMRAKGVNPNCPDDEHPERPLLYRYAHDAATGEMGLFHHLIVMLINRADPCYAVGAGQKSTIELIKDEGNTKYHGHVFQLLKSFMQTYHLESFNRQLLDELDEFDNPEDHQRILLNNFPVGIPRYLRCASYKKQDASEQFFVQLAGLDPLKFRRALHIWRSNTSFDRSNIERLIQAVLSGESKRDAADKIRAIITEYQSRNEYMSARELLNPLVAFYSVKANKSKDLSPLAVLFAAGADSNCNDSVTWSPFTLSILSAGLLHDVPQYPYSSVVFGLMNSMRHTTTEEHNDESL